MEKTVIAPRQDLCACWLGETMKGNVMVHNGMTEEPWDVA